jgi:hypothetical protein
LCEAEGSEIIGKVFEESGRKIGGNLIKLERLEVGF